MEQKINTWFEVKVKSTTITEEGKTKNSSKIYYVNAVSFTDAETRICEEMETLGVYSFSVEAIKKTNIEDVLVSDSYDDDKWYKYKVTIPAMDDVENGKDINYYGLVEASGTNRALEFIDDFCNCHFQFYEIGSVSDTKIMDVFPCNDKGDE